MLLPPCCVWNILCYKRQEKKSYDCPVMLSPEHTHSHTHIPSLCIYYTGIWSVWEGANSFTFRHKCGNTADRRQEDAACDAEL